MTARQGTAKNCKNIPTELTAATATVDSSDCEGFGYSCFIFRVVHLGYPTRLGAGPLGYWYNNNVPYAASLLIVMLAGQGIWICPSGFQTVPRTSLLVKGLTPPISWHSFQEGVAIRVSLLPTVFRGALSALPCARVCQNGINQTPILDLQQTTTVYHPRVISTTHCNCSTRSDRWLRVCIFLLHPSRRPEKGDMTVRRRKSGRKYVIHTY